MSEGVTRPPFGAKVARFLCIGYHPRLEVRPGTYKSRKIGPGCYQWNKPQKIVSKVPRWKAQKKTEEYSRSLGYVGDHLIRRRKWFKSINGPGWQDVPSTALDAGVTFSKGERFPVPKQKTYAVPGPGIYGKYHIPYTRYEEKRKEKGFSFSTLNSFDQHSNAARSLTIQRSYHLPPNIYEIKSSVQELLNKTISKRGPYQVFTVERFPDPLVYNVSAIRHRLHFSDLSHPKNAFKGTFQKCGKESNVTSRLAINNLSLFRKNPLDPGPSHYDPYPTKSISRSLAPFNSSSVEPRPVVKCGFAAPPGRYNHEFKKSILGDGMKSAFLSKVQRGVPLPEKLSWFE